MNENTQLLLKEARAMGFVVEVIDDISGFSIKLAHHRYYFRGMETPYNSYVSAELAKNKFCTSELLRRAGFPIPKSTSFNHTILKPGELERQLTTLQFPLVAKPTCDSSLGKEVLCNIGTLDQLRTYLQDAFTRHEFISVEEFHGDMLSYRVMVFNGEVLGVVERYPATVVGDGQHSIRDLIPLHNERRAQLNSALGPLKLDQEALIYLADQGLEPDYIPRLNEEVTLLHTSNATRGGTFKSLGKKLCRANKKLCIDACKTLELNLAGVDLECHDINQPLSETGGVIIEINQNPSIKIHQNPMAGIPVPITKKLLLPLIYRHPIAYLFTEGAHRKMRFYSKIFLSIAIVALLGWLAR